MNQCTNCGNDFSKRHQIKYCSNKCQFDFQYKAWVKRWKNGELNGNTGITVRSISGHLKRYLEEKFGNKCSICGRSQKHQITGNVPLEIDHIDGDSENNLEINLHLICPNCHALTLFYKSLNKGRGRAWRKMKYLKNKD